MALFCVITIAIIASLLISLPACVEEYWPDLGENSDNLLVVDGGITTDPGPYFIRLSRSCPVHNPEFIPVVDAIVMIMDNTGVQEVLIETSDGIYETSESGIQGVVGRKYKLHITTQSGTAYESDFEEILEPVGVESVEYKKETHVLDNTGDTEQTGYQFYLTTKLSSRSENYYYWKLEETYEYHSAYKILFYYNGINLPPDPAHPLGLQRTLNPDTLYACWKTGFLKERFTYSTQFLSVPVIEDLPLHFISFGDERLQKQYSVLAKQYTISENAYAFQKALEEQNSNQGGLITVQPYQVRGNIKNIHDPDEAVLGYFNAASVAEAPRIFVAAPQYYSLSCGYDTTEYNIVRFINLSKPSSWPVYFTYVYFPNPNDPMGEAIEALALVYQDCLDCTKRGGVAVKPDFWND